MNEHCDKCGKAYYEKHGVYRLSDDFWEIVYFGVMGKEANGGGLLCMDCINEEFATLIYWEGSQVDYPTTDLRAQLAAAQERLKLYEELEKTADELFKADAAWKAHNQAECVYCSRHKDCFDLDALGENCTDLAIELQAILAALKTKKTTPPDSDHP